MKKKNILYNLLCIFGLLLHLLVMLLYSSDQLSRPLYMMCSGFTFILFSTGLTLSLRLMLQKNDPELKKALEIESSDERLRFIKRQSSSLAGEVLQWMLLITALIFIGVGAPIWMSLVLIFLVILKVFIEFLISIYYQDKF